MPDARAPRNSKPRGGSARKAAAAGRTSSGWQPTGHGKKSTDATLPTLNKATPSAGAPLFKPTNGKVYTESRAMFAQPSAAPHPTTNRSEWGRKKSDITEHFFAKPNAQVLPMGFASVDADLFVG